MNSSSLAILANPQGTTGIDAGWRELAKVLAGIVGASVPHGKVNPLRSKRAAGVF